MITRRSFLAALRNRVAAGVLCSAMLVDALERMVVEEPALKYIMAFQVSQELIEDDLYRTINFGDGNWLTKKSL